MNTPMNALLALLALQTRGLLLEARDELAKRHASGNALGVRNWLQIILGYEAAFTTLELLRSRNEGELDLLEQLETMAEDFRQNRNPRAMGSVRNVLCLARPLVLGLSWEREELSAALPAGVLSAEKPASSPIQASGATIAPKPNSWAN